MPGKMACATLFKARRTPSPMFLVYRLASRYRRRRAMLLPADSAAEHRQHAKTLARFPPQPPPGLESETPGRFDASIQIEINVPLIRNINYTFKPLRYRACRLFRRHIYYVLASQWSRALDMSFPPPPTRSRLR